MQQDSATRGNVILKRFPGFEEYRGEYWTDTGQVMVYLGRMENICIPDIVEEVRLG